MNDLKAASLQPCTTGPEIEVFIVGAGPAGLAAAIAAAMQGLRVEVADARTPPIDKACGEGLMPDTLAALNRLGVHVDRLPPNSSHLLRGIRFIGTPTDTRHPTTNEAVFPEGPGRGVRRTVLHQLLLHRALALGVRFRWETVVQGIEGTRVHTNAGTLHARWIIGADGHQSRLRSLAGLDRASASIRRVALRQHFSTTPWTDFVEVHWTDHGQAYVTPISPNEVCVAFIASKKLPGVQHALSLYPELHRRLASAVPSDAPTGGVTLSRRLRRVTSGNVALIGDASGSVDAITGEGLALCFRQALALAEALQTADPLSPNPLAAYQLAHTRIHRLPHIMSRSMLLMDRSPRVLTRALTTLERKPGLFSHLLEVHIGHSPVRLLGSTGLIASALCFLTI